MMRRHHPAGPIWTIVVLLYCTCATLQAQLIPRANLQGRANAVACPRTTADAYAIAQLYKNGAFAEITNMEPCVGTLYDATKPSENPSLELLSVTETFLHFYALSCLAQNKHTSAEMATSRLLERFPLHQIDPDMDPPQFRMLLDSLVPYGANHYGIYGGTNYCLIRNEDPTALRTDITPSGPLTIGPIFRGLPRYDVGFIWQHHFGFRHSWVSGIGLNGMAYFTRYASREFERIQAQEGDWIITQYDKYTFLNVPLTYQYRFPIGKGHARRRLWLGLEIGGYGKLLFRGETELLTSEWKKEDGTNLVEDVVHTTISSPLERRQRLSAGLTGGVSFQADYGPLSFFVRASGQWGLTQMRRADSEYDDEFQQYIWQYHIVDQNFKMHALQLTVGIMFPKTYRVKNLHDL